MREESNWGTILGVRFWIGNCEGAVERALHGGLVVAPSGPGMACDLYLRPAYSAALRTADLALTDSGYMVLCHALLSGAWIPRNSGLKFLQLFLETQRHRFGQQGESFWVMPTQLAAAGNRRWLNENGYAVTELDCFLAPVYDRSKIEDPDLLKRIEEKQPKLVVLCVGGGVQEPLGAWLRANLSYRPTILCTGAAIAFLSNVQTNIPPWADRYFLGWILRILNQPALYSKRFLSALPLIGRMAIDRVHRPD